MPVWRKGRVREWDRQEGQTDSSGFLCFVQECHKAVIRVRLAMTMRQRDAGIVSDQINFGFLVAAGRDNVV